MIKIQKKSNSMSVAADALLNDYTADKELTAFTNLDFDDFYKMQGSSYDSTKYKRMRYRKNI